MSNYLSKSLLPIFCFLCFLILSPQLVAQNYYVAFVKGKVFYNENPLKVRDKITLSGNLRFSSGSDFIKVSGPNGLHSISPQKKEGGGYEFLRAVTAELFPVAKPVNSMVLSAWNDLSDHISLHDRNQFIPDVFLEGEWRKLPEHVDNPNGQNFYWVSDAPNPKQRTIKIATVRDSAIVLDRENFALAYPDSTAFLFQVTDEKAFRKLVTKTKSLWDLSVFLTAEVNVSEYTPALPEKLARKKLKYANKPLPARYLTYLRPKQVLPSDQILEDMWFFFNNNPAKDFHRFMFSYLSESPGYDSILREQYGEMDFLSVLELFERYVRKRE